MNQELGTVNNILEVEVVAVAKQLGLQWSVLRELDLVHLIRRDWTTKDLESW